MDDFQMPEIPVCVCSDSLFKWAVLKPAGLQLDMKENMQLYCQVDISSDGSFQIVQDTANCDFKLKKV